MVPGVSSGGAASPLNGTSQTGEQQTTEQMLALVSSLKTRVSELEVINELYRGRITQIESEDSKTRDEMRVRIEDLERNLSESHHRENLLKRRLDEMETESLERTARSEQVHSESIQTQERYDQIRTGYDRLDAEKRKLKEGYHGLECKNRELESENARLRAEVGVEPLHKKRRLGDGHSSFDTENDSQINPNISLAAIAAAAADVAEIPEASMSDVAAEMDPEPLHDAVQANATEGTEAAATTAE